MSKHTTGIPQPKSGNKKKKPSISKLKKRLWEQFSLYIRNRDGWTCFTCGRKGEGSGIHAGHFIPKASGGLALYFNEDNVHAQCFHCNHHLGGNQWEYGLKLGPKKVEELYKLKNENWKWSIFEYEQKIEEYREKVMQLKTNVEESIV